MLIIAAPEERIELITWQIDKAQHQPLLSFRGEIIVKEPKRQRGDRFVPGKWNLISASGVRATVSGGGEIRGSWLLYEWEFEPIVSDIGNTIDYNMVVSVRFDNRKSEPREFKTATSGNLSLGKRHSMLLGTTAEGEEIHLRLTATLKSPRRPDALETPEKKQQLIDCIRRQLAK